MESNKHCIWLPFKRPGKIMTAFYLTKIKSTPLNLGAEKTKYKEHFMSLAGNNTIGSTITLVEQGISES